MNDADYEVTVEVQVRKPGDFNTRLTWGSGEVELEAPGVREAVVEALRQTVGDAQLDLGIGPPPPRDPGKWSP